MSYTTPELSFDEISEVATHLPIHRIGELEMLGDIGPLFVEKEIRRRIRVAVSPYVHPDHFDEFALVLQECEGAIIGSVVREVLLENGSVPMPRRPANLNLVTRLCLEDPMRSFLHGLGYTSVVLDPSERSNESVDLVERFTLDVEHERRIVIMSVSKSRAIRVVLATPFTAQMNAITHDRIICLHPRATFANESFVVDGHNLGAGEADDARGFNVLGDNAHWTEPCGLQCPATWRKTPDDKGAAMYSWSLEEAWQSTWDPTRRLPLRAPFTSRSTTVDSGLAFMSAEALTWRARSRCCNMHCPNMQLFERRVRILLP
ncbi:hypothetical protein DFP72DRAFT_1068854 [Ephemerocybe angulata]|uniref:Uncharacterized protein n=1 Tax=Ephemerocybe angulata TaxID=980116 RepID=A0A8H6HX98_9AGAR|nr:hypothetical protein DFP72DRAFT_1068854 [Tulosesus angulatus]